MGKSRIVVVGYGWVGQANALALAQMGYNVFYYDIVVSKLHHYDHRYSRLYRKVMRLDSLLGNDSKHVCYIVCVGDSLTKEGKQDIRAIKKVLDTLRLTQGKVVLRSTVLPCFLSELPFDYYFPEFLHERCAIEECLNPYYFVLGVDRETKANDRPRFLLEWEGRAKKVFIGGCTQASYIKYLSNIWNALRIAFVNEFGDCVLGGHNLKETEEVVDFIFEKADYLRYGKPYEGHCLPKDVRSFFAAFAHITPITEAIYKSNEIHKMFDQADKLSTWYSKWERGKK